MRTRRIVSIFALLFTVLPVAATRGADPHYNFTAGQTNVFSVEISVRGENGSETSTGNVFVVTKDLSTNSATLSCRALLRNENRRAQARGFGMPPYYPGGMIQNVFPNNSEVTVDFQGNEIRDSGDYVLAVPLGKLIQSLFPPLPVKSGNSESSDHADVLDDPYWLGPADSFSNVRQNGSPMYMNNFYSGMGNGPATLWVARQISSRYKTTSAELAELHRETSMQSLVQTGDQPRVAATSTTDATFDQNLGRATQIETQGEVISQTDTTSRQAKVTFRARLLSGQELDAALAPTPSFTPMAGPATMQKLDSTNVEALEADLKSMENNKWRNALNQLSYTPIQAPPPELADLVATFASNEDSFIRQNVATFLQKYGTTNQVVTLLKLLKDPDTFTCVSAAKALARLKDERAIAPTVDVLAGGVRVNQYGQIENYQFVSDIASALAQFGPAAEKPVLGLLSERNIETRRQACIVLKQIGTADSLGPLQKLVADSNPQLGQAADAIREINQRM
jgi:hypothetical protein